MAAESFIIGGMVSTNTEAAEQRRLNWRRWVSFTQSASVIALVISLVSFYRSYFYINQNLQVTVTEVSYSTNRGELYMTVAFSNGGNREAAVLRAEPALWSRDSAKPQPQWIPIARPVAPEIPLTSPKTPLVVKSGGVEVLTLSTMLEPTDAERAQVASRGSAFLGIRVATMNSDGNLYRIERPVARLIVDKRGRITGADPAIHQTLSGFSDIELAPPGESRTANKQTPFVWAEEDYR